ncbi:MAG: MarR family winged helix-turn-helix transcriptional regulator [Nitrospiraceae bacterium]
MGQATAEGDDTLTMRGVEHNGHEKLTLLELVLQLQGEFRRSLEPIRVTPLQAGVILYRQRHIEAKLTDAAAALRVTQPTLSEVVKDLVRKRWVIKRRLHTDTSAVCLALSRQGEALPRRIEGQVRDVCSQINYKIEAKQK